MEKQVKIPWDDWTLVKSIGEGGFGRVYEIQRTQHGITEKAAMKVLSIPQSSAEIENLQIEGYTDDGITQRFSRFADDIIKEYGMMVQMKGNANIVYCDDYKAIQHDDGFGWDIYIKMELLTPLMKVVQQVTTEDQIIRLGLDICNALVVCQRRNVIHRDIKPQNVFISEDGVYKLGDFGIARTAEQTTRGTVGIGTYQFMAPEVKNDQQYNATVDIYSLGLMLHWLLNERRSPFLPLPPAIPRHGEDEIARQRRFAGEPIPAPKNGSEALKAIVLKACAYDPKDRYQSAQEMMDALTALKTGAAPVVEPVIEKPSNDPTPAIDTVEDDILTVGPGWSNVKEEPAADDMTVGPGWAVPVEDDVTVGLTNDTADDVTVGPKFNERQLAEKEYLDKKNEEKPKAKKKSWFLTICLVCVVALFAILLPRINKSPSTSQLSSPSEIETSSKIETSSIQQTDEQSEQIFSAEDTRIFMSAAYYNAPYASPLMSAVENECNNLGYEISIVDGRVDSATQLAQFQEAYEGGYNAFIYWPSDAYSSEPVIEYLNSTGLPWVIVNTAPMPALYDQCTIVASDEVQVGRELGKLVVKYYEEHGSEPLSIAYIEGDSRSSYTINLTKGIHEVIDSYADIKILNEAMYSNFDPATAMTIMEDLITSFGDEIDLVLTQDGGMFQGAYNAIHAAGKLGQYGIICQGQDLFVMEKLLSGELYASVSQDPFQEGVLAVEVLHELLQGKPIDTWISTPAEPIFANDVNNFAWF